MKLNQKVSSELAPGVLSKQRMGWQQKIFWGAVGHARGHRFVSAWPEALKKHARSPLSHTITPPALEEGSSSNRRMFVQMDLEEVSAGVRMTEET